VPTAGSMRSLSASLGTRVFPFFRRAANLTPSAKSASAIALSCAGDPGRTHWTRRGTSAEREIAKRLQITIAAAVVDRVRCPKAAEEVPVRSSRGAGRRGGLRVATVAMLPVARRPDGGPVRGRSMSSQTVTSDERGARRLPR